MRLPITGQTEDSAKVTDQNWAAFLKETEEKKELMKRLEMSKLEDEADERALKKRIGKKQGEENAENEGDAQNQEE